jgi:hypothetical protein
VIKKFCQGYRIVPVESRQLHGMQPNFVHWRYHYTRNEHTISNRFDERKNDVGIIVAMSNNEGESSWQQFLDHIRRGRKFENWERGQWIGDLNERAVFEAGTVLKGKRGRIDIKLFDEEEGHTIIAEIKATDWDRMGPHRVRPNVLRHARQIWRYIEAELETADVLPAIIYPKTPETPGRKEQIEAILHEKWIQVVWRDERDDTL